MTEMALYWATCTAFLVWFLIYWRGGLDALKSLVSALREKNYPDAAAMTTIGFMMLLLTIGMLAASLGWMSILGSFLCSALGLFLTLLGIGGTVYSRYYLGKFWTAQAAVSDGHRIVDQGPYGIVRHPIYSFVLILYIGIGLAFPTLLNVMAVLVTLLCYVIKTGIEDNYLAANLPGYQEYREHVPWRLIPRIW